jgi:hypothetical protein
MAALECLRDIDLEKQCIAAAAAGHNMRHTRWCNSMAGEEYARLYSWGNDPKRAVSDLVTSERCTSYNHIFLIGVIIGRLRCSQSMRSRRFTADRTGAHPRSERSA